MEEFSIPGIVLMENAGHGLARHVAAAAGFSQGDGREHRPVAVVAGKGNNGGDGFVCARHLLNWGCPVAPIAYVGDLGAALERARAGTGGDWGTNLLILERMGHPLLAVSDPGSDAGFADLLGGAAVVVDALLGTGLRGEVRDPFRAAIDVINRATCPVVAADLPSGLDADTGRPLGVAVRARSTVTFAAPKLGFHQPGADAWVGRVVVVDIGCPRSLITAAAPSGGGSG